MAESAGRHAPARQGPAREVAVALHATCVKGCRAPIHGPKAVVHLDSRLGSGGTSRPAQGKLPVPQELLCLSVFAVPNPYRDVGENGATRVGELEYRYSSS